MLVRELVTLLSFDVDSHGFEHAAGKLAELAIAAGGIVAAVYEFKNLFLDSAKEAAEYAEKVERASLTTGVATDDLQGLAFAPAHAGLSMAGLVGTFAHLARTSNAARTGSQEAAKSFNDLGIGLTDLTTGKAKNPAKLFEEIAEKVSKISDPMKRN